MDYSMCSEKRSLRCLQKELTSVFSLDECYDHHCLETAKSAARFQEQLKLKESQLRESQVCFVCLSLFLRACLFVSNFL